MKVMVVHLFLHVVKRVQRTDKTLHDTIQRLFCQPSMIEPETASFSLKIMKSGIDESQLHAKKLVWSSWGKRGS